MCYGETLKPGDKALLDLSDNYAEDYCKETLSLNKTVVTIGRKHTGILKSGWWIEDKNGDEWMWFEYNNFKPILSTTSCSTTSPINLSSPYCKCENPDLVVNYAGGDRFYFCRRCKNECF